MEAVWAHFQVRNELVELFGGFGWQSFTLAHELQELAFVPLRVHARYS